jgi:hypothetical protein
VLIAIRPTVVLIGSVCLSNALFWEVSSKKGEFEKEGEFEKICLEKWNDGLGVGEHLRRPRIFCMFSGSSEMILYGSPNVRLTFV